MKIKDIKGSIFLLLATIIWGCTFVAQEIAAEVIGPFEFQAVRTIIGAIVLVPVILFMDNTKKKSHPQMAFPKCYVYLILLRNH